MISVCVATYNGEKFIYRQLESILRQLSTTDEIIISDDGSTDKTLDLIISFNDPRILIVKNNGKKGPMFNFQNALSFCKGDLIFLADQDDVWLDGKVALMSDLLIVYDLVLSDCIIVNEERKVLHSSFFGIRKSRQGVLPNLLKNSYMGCCMAFRRKILKYALPFPNSVYMHDWWIGLIAELYGTVYFLKVPLIEYVRHENNFSPTGQNSLPLHISIFNRISLVRNVISRLFSINFSHQ